MPATDPSVLGPLGALVGTWEGDQGVDVSYHNVDNVVGDTAYRERIVMNPFGPVDHGKQCLCGLDYRMSAWRGDEVDPFHTEVGDWLWDGAAGQVMRCFMVPRGSTVLAGGAAAADAKEFSMQAEVGSSTYGILSNLYLDQMARTTAYQVTITVHDGNSWSYDETSWIRLAHMDAPVVHTDRNTLQRVLS